MKNRTYNIVLVGVFTALALIFSYIEFLIPIPIGVPGIKLGLANSLTLAIFFILGPKFGFLVNLLRVLLSAILFGSIFSLWFSLAGFLISFLFVYIFYKIDAFSVIGLSILGSVTHNVGQIIVACFLIKSLGPVTYLSVLTPIGIFTGFLTGIISTILYKRMKKYDSIS